MCLAQLKVAFDNAEKVKPGISHQFVVYLIETIRAFVLQPHNPLSLLSYLKNTHDKLLLGENVEQSAAAPTAPLKTKAEHTSGIAVACSQKELSSSSNIHDTSTLVHTHRTTATARNTAAML